MKLKYSLTILLFINISVAHAADLRGKLTGIPGAQINVNCQGFTASTHISSNGSYHISDLPANKACHFTVHAGNTVSVNIPFSSKSSVTVYNGTLQNFNNKILVIRK